MVDIARLDAPESAAQPGSQLDAGRQPAAPDDRTLIDRVLARDLAAFDTLMQRHNQRLYRAVRSILADEAEAEDAVQDTWWKAYCHLADFRHESQPATWLTRIAVNEALMRRRRRQARDSVIEDRVGASPGDEPASLEDSIAAARETSRPDELAWQGEVRQLIEQRIDRLPDRYRTVFVLRAVDDMSMARCALNWKRRRSDWGWPIE